MCARIRIIGVMTIAFVGGDRFIFIIIRRDREVRRVLNFRIASAKTASRINYSEKSNENSETVPRFSSLCLYFIYQPQHKRKNEKKTKKNPFLLFNTLFACVRIDSRYKKCCALFSCLFRDSSYFLCRGLICG